MNYLVIKFNKTNISKFFKNKEMPGMNGYTGAQQAMPDAQNHMMLMQNSM